MKMPSWTVWLVTGSVLVITARTYFDYILQAIHRMKAYAAAQIVFVALSVAGLTLIFVGFFPKTYLTVIIVGLIVNTITLILLSLFLIPLRFYHPVKTDRRMLREVLSFSYPLMIGNLAAYIVNWIDVIVIKHYFSMSEVGGYQLAYNMFNLLGGLVGSLTSINHSNTRILFGGQTRRFDFTLSALALSRKVSYFGQLSIGIVLEHLSSNFSKYFWRRIQCIRTLFPISCHWIGYQWTD